MSTNNIDEQSIEESIANLRTRIEKLEQNHLKKVSGARSDYKATIVKLKASTDELKALMAEEFGEMIRTMDAQETSINKLQM